MYTINRRANYSPLKQNPLFLNRRRGLFLCNHLFTNRTFVRIINLRCIIMKIDMLGPEFNKFGEMFDKLYVGREPLYAIITSLENMMTANKINFFKLPAFKSKDFRNHYFIFKVVDDRYVFSYLK